MLTLRTRGLFSKHFTVDTCPLNRMLPPRSLQPYQQQGARQIAGVQQWQLPHKLSETVLPDTTLVLPSSAAACPSLLTGKLAP